MADGKQEGGTEQLISWIIIFIMVVVALYFVYRNFAPEVHSAIRWIRYAELWFISLFTFESYSIPPFEGKFTLEEFRDYTAKIQTDDLTTSHISKMSHMAMYPLKWFIIAIIALMAVWTYRKGPGTQYTEVFNLDRFIKFQSNAFPIISPFIKFNPAKQPPRPPGSDVPAELPAFAEALGPEEWLAYYEVPIKDNKIDDKNTVFKAFARQLGPRWKGVKNLEPYKQILLAAFCLKAARKREASDDMLSRLAQCWSHDKGLQLSKQAGLLKEARKVLRNKDLSHSVIKKCNQHAWQTTAMLRGLLVAREEGGVLAPAQFVWLRAHDRVLWYPLNNLGRQSNHTEAIGAMAHFRNEKRAKRPIPKPKVQEAVTSLVEYMNSNNARPVPHLDYSQSKNKRGIKKMKEG